MEAENKTYLELTGLITLVFASFVGVLLIDNLWLKLVLLFVWSWLALAVWFVVRPAALPRQLLTVLLFVFIGSTFLNQEILSLRIGMMTLFIYRLVLAVCTLYFVYALLRGQWLRQTIQRSPVRAYLLFFVIWGFYGAGSLIWSASINEAFKYLLLLATGLVFVLFAALVLPNWRSLKWFHSIWLIMTALLLLIGLINVMGHIQLPTSSLYQGPAYKLMYPTAVFTNQNDFATLLAISFFFFLAYTMDKKQFMLKLGGLIGAGLSLVLVVLAESRASEIGIAAGLACFLFLSIAPQFRRRIAIACGLVALAGCLLLSGTLLSKAAHYATVETNYSINDLPASNIVRMHLLESTADYLADSFGFGTGAGNLSYALANQPVYNTNHIFEAHNWLAEITGTFGIFIGAGYLVIYLALFRSLYYYARPLPPHTKGMLLRSALCAQVSFLFSSISPSSVSNLYFQWLFLGFLIALLACLRKQAQASYSGGL